jgi:hypothetical protein
VCVCVCEVNLWYMGTPLIWESKCKMDVDWEILSSKWLLMLLLCD